MIKQFEDALREKGLSKREIQVAAFLLWSKKNHEIASELSISEKTIKYHLTSVFKKLAVTNRIDCRTKLIGMTDQP